MVKTNYSGSADLFTKRLVDSLCTPFSDLKKRCPYAAHMVVASVDHPYMMYGFFFLFFFYK